MERPALIALFALPVLIFAWICWSRFWALLRRPRGEAGLRRDDFFNEARDRVRARRFMGMEYPQATPPWMRPETQESQERRLA
jgi:hypothetical protein